MMSLHLQLFKLDLCILGCIFHMFTHRGNLVKKTKCSCFFSLRHNEGWEERKELLVGFESRPVRVYVVPEVDVFEPPNHQLGTRTLILSSTSFSSHFLSPLLLSSVSLSHHSSKPSFPPSLRRPQDEWTIVHWGAAAVCMEVCEVRARTVWLCTVYMLCVCVLGSGYCRSQSTPRR